MPVISGVSTDCEAHLIGADLCALAGYELPAASQI